MDWRKCRFFQEVKSRELILKEAPSFHPRFFLALDVSYARGYAFTAALLYDALTGKEVERRGAVSRVNIPYVPPKVFSEAIPDEKPGQTGGDASPPGHHRGDSPTRHPT